MTRKDHFICASAVFAGLGVSAYAFEGIEFHTWHLFLWVVIIGATVFFLCYSTSESQSSRQSWNTLAQWRKDQRYQSTYEPRHEMHIDPERQDPRRWFMDGDVAVYAIPGLIMSGPNMIMWIDEDGNVFEANGQLSICCSGDMEWRASGPTIKCDEQFGDTWTREAFEQKPQR